jgi:putative transposase
VNKLPTIVQYCVSDYGPQQRSWAFGQRLRAAGAIFSMGTVDECYDNTMMESFWGHDATI